MLKKSEKVNMTNHLRDVTKMVMVILLLSSCTRTVYQERDVVRHDSIYIAAVSVDTVMQRDSIHIRERGDTIEKVVYKYINNVRIRRDTIVQERTDTISKVVTKVETKTVRKRDWLSCIGAFAIGIIIGLVICFRKRGK